MDSLGSSVEKRKCDVLVSGCWKKCGGLYASMILLFSKNVVIKSRRSYDYIPQENLEVTCTVDVVSKRLERAYLKWCPNDDVDQNHGPGAETLHKGDVSWRTRSGMNYFQNLQGCEDLSSASHKIAPLAKRSPLSLRRYSLDWFDSLG